MATQARLVAGTINSLIEIGFSKTTGVEVCRRAGLTRGALNHHFPDFADLLVETLQRIYLQLLDIKLEDDADIGQLEQIMLEGHLRVIQPEFKAVIELWLASRNDETFGHRLAKAIALNSELFSLEMILNTKSHNANSVEFEAVYRTIFETLIGIGLGRAVGNGEPTAHESLVLPVLQNMAREYDLSCERRNLSVAP